MNGPLEEEKAFPWLLSLKHNSDLHWEKKIPQYLHWTSDYFTSMSSFIFSDAFFLCVIGGSTFGKSGVFITSSPAGKNVAFSYLYQKQRTKPALRSKKDRVVERHLLSFLALSLSPLHCVICGNICFLCCSFPSCGGCVLYVPPSSLF